MTKRITIEQMPPVENEEQKRHLIRYVNFINSRPERDLHQKGFHTHHIYPKSIAKKNNVEDFNGDWNLIELTPREHFIAHMILWKAYKGKMTQAFWYMNHNKKYNEKLTARQYEKLEFEKRKILGEISKNKTCVNNGTNNLWIKLDDQIPNGYKKGMLTHLNGTVWVNNGKKCIQVKPENIPKGWNLGMLDERMWINNGVENKFVKTDEEIPENFVKGRLSIGYWIHNDKEEKYTNEDIVPQGYKVGRLLSTTKNTKWITNGSENKMISKDSDVDDGWRLGVTTDVKGYRLITDGNTTKYLYDGEIMPEGWRYGSLQNQQYVNWINNGQVNKKWDMSKELPDGFKPGKIVKGFFITDGKTSKLVQSEEDMPEGWRKGRLKRTKEQIKNNLTI